MMTSHLQKDDRRCPSLLLAAAILLGAGCSASQSAVREADPWAVYSESIYAAAVFNSENIDTTLYRAPFLQAGDSVEVAAWTPVEAAERYYPVGILPPLAVDVWVTLAPQVQHMCRTFPADSTKLRLRLQQLLGLPPQVETRKFVVMRAAKDDLFRPCTNPDPTQNRCGEVFPEDISDEHKVWIAEHMLSLYQAAGQNGYPWTRLGYTYDWNPATSKFGASEYIIRKGAVVRVLHKYSTGSYCHLGQ